MEANCLHRSGAGLRAGADIRNVTVPLDSPWVQHLGSGPSPRWAGTTLKKPAPGDGIDRPGGGFGFPLFFGAEPPGRSLARREPWRSAVALAGLPLMPEQEREAFLFGLIGRQGPGPRLGAFDRGFSLPGTGLSLQRFRLGGSRRR